MHNLVFVIINFVVIFPGQLGETPVASMYIKLTFDTDGFCGAAVPPIHCTSYMALAIHCVSYRVLDGPVWPKTSL